MSRWRSVYVDMQISFSPSSLIPGRASHAVETDPFRRLHSLSAVTVTNCGQHPAGTVTGRGPAASRPRGQDGLIVRMARAPPSCHSGWMAGLQDSGTAGLLSWDTGLCLIGS